MTAKQKEFLVGCLTLIPLVILVRTLIQQAGIITTLKWFGIFIGLFLVLSMWVYNCHWQNRS